ncbi:hypothetical protein, partial [Rickettsiella grylli]|uniref:hypothetical protein n=1 Tax=Rickettsiella grylli TaxID=59196 RepID=UPI001C0A9B4D
KAGHCTIKFELIHVNSELANSLRFTKTFYSFPTLNISTKRLNSPNAWTVPLIELANLSY